MLILKAPSKEIKIPKNMASYFTILVERWKKHKICFFKSKTKYFDNRENSLSGTIFEWIALKIIRFMFGGGSVNNKRVVMKKYIVKMSSK